MANKKEISVFITDLDNTLFDWFDIWYHPFSAMLNSVSATSGISKEILLPEIREIHQRHGTSEYAFLLEAIPSLQKLHPGCSIIDIYQDAIDLYSSVRSQHMKLYAHVLETLKYLRSQGTLIVVYTESKAYYTNYRLRKLHLDEAIDILYSPADHELPRGLSSEDIRSKPTDNYILRNTQHRYTPPDTIKPDPDLLLNIVREVNSDPRRCLYLGDSLFKDIDMAQRAGIVDVYAKYGVVQHHEGYDLLRSVSHWTNVDVEKEKQASTKVIEPSYTCNISIREVLEHFSFVSHSNT